MNKFQELYDTILLEMPYLFDLSKDNIPNGNEHFDLEFEKIRNRKELTKYIYKLLFGGKNTDKYGNSIFINTPEARKKFLDRLLNSPDVIYYVKVVIGAPSEKSAKNWLVNLEKQLSQKINVSEGMQIRWPMNVYVIYNQDNTKVLKSRIRAYSEKQARAYFLRLNPEYLNDRLFTVVAERDEPVARLPYKD